MSKKREVTARVWTMGDARKALDDPQNAKDRMDIARRFPLFATASESEVYEALNLLEYLTVRKVERALKRLHGIIVDDIDEDIEEEDDTEEVTTKVAATQEPVTTTTKPDPGAKPANVKTPLKPNGAALALAALHK